MNWFWQGSDSTTTELPEIYSLTVAENEFVTTDVENIFSRILTDVLERTEGLTEDEQALLWDNCLANESQMGLVTMLSKAIVAKEELFIVYDASLKVIRKATGPETDQIKDDYEKTGDSKTGVYVSFKNYRKADMVKLYSGLEYSTVAALAKSMNLSKAIQVKISDLRASVALGDSATAKAQASTIATALKCGRDVAMDAKDSIETTKPDLTATQAAMEFIANKQSFYLGLPSSYIMGDISVGMSDTGKADSRAIERGLRSYFTSIIKPITKAVFQKDCTFKSEDFDMLDVKLNALKTFDVTSGEFLSAETKLKLVNKLFGLPAETKGDAPDETTIDPLTGQPIDPSLQQKGQQPKPGAKPTFGAPSKPNA